MLVEVKLDLLVGDVDAELLERVLLEVLEAEDVQDADGLEVVSASDAVVEPADDPVEAPGVERHGHGVSGVHRLRRTTG